MQTFGEGVGRPSNLLLPGQPARAGDGFRCRTHIAHPGTGGREVHLAEALRRRSVVTLCRREARLTYPQVYIHCALATEYPGRARLDGRGRRQEGTPSCSSPSVRHPRASRSSSRPRAPTGSPASPAASSRTGLVACGQNAAPITVISRRGGKVRDEVQARVALHTRQALVRDVVALVERDHPDDVPCVVALRADRRQLRVPAVGRAGDRGSRARGRRPPLDRRGRRAPRRGSWW